MNHDEEFEQQEKADRETDQYLLDILMNKEHKTVEVEELPNCDICEAGMIKKQAQYDCNLGSGWGNVCQDHFETFNCRLGLGKGQKLTLKK